MSAMLRVEDVLKEGFDYYKKQFATFIVATVIAIVLFDTHSNSTPSGLWSIPYRAEDYSRGRDQNYGCLQGL